MSTGKIIINIDILFFNDFLMSLVLLWATAKFAGLKVRLWRMIGSALFGSIYTVILVLPLFRGLTDIMYFIFHLFLNLVVATIMIKIAFGSMKRQKFIKTLGYFYLITFLAGGAAFSIYFVVGASPTKWIFDWINLSNAYGWLYFAAIILVFFVGRHGWNLIRERLFKEQYHLKFIVWIEDRPIEIMGLLDTGNLLKDPVTNMPVIVIEKEIISEFFPIELREILDNKEMDIVDQVESLFKTTWFNRFRIIPFSSLGIKGGLLIGLRPDRVEILGRENPYIERVILALHQGELDLEGEYQALLHPNLLEAI